MSSSSLNHHLVIDSDYVWVSILANILSIILPSLVFLTFEKIAVHVYTW